MRSFFFGIVVLSSMLSGACSGNAPDTAKSGNESPSAANSAATVDPGPGPGSVNSSPQAAATVVEPPRRRRRQATVGEPGPEAALEFRPCPESSECATTMNAQGQPTEVRVFKENAQLTRVEAVWLGPKDKLLKITLASGTTVEVKTDQIADLASASVQRLVELASGQ